MEGTEEVECPEMRQYADAQVVLIRAAVRVSDQRILRHTLPCGYGRLFDTSRKASILEGQSCDITLAKLILTRSPWLPFDVLDYELRVTLSL